MSAGEILLGVQRLVVTLRGGLVTPEAFQEKCEQALCNLSELFRDLEGRILLDARSVRTPLFPDAIRRYREKRIAELLGVETLFQLGIEELIRYFDDRSVAHLDSGTYLIKRAEADLNGLQALLEGQIDHPLSCLDIGGDLFGILAEQLMRGELKPEDYAELLGNYMVETLDTARIGQEALVEAVSLLQSFDGTNPEIFEQAADRLQTASNRWLAAAANCLEQPASEAGGPS